MGKFKIICVVRARPNFMKIAPIIEAFKEDTPDISTLLLHTGQHYDHAMKTLLFDQLGIPVPDIDLEVRGGTHAEQTANIMLKFEGVLDEEKPDAILVVGDVNSTIACALVAIKKHIPVIHVEAGLRSRDIYMPEEVNRLLTDQISSLLFTTERLGNENLVKEGVSPDKVKFVGNVMIDTLRKNQKITPSVEDVFSRLGFEQLNSNEPFSVLTLHRPSNVDNKETLEILLRSMAEVSKTLPIIFAMHPRTTSRVEEFGLNDIIEQANIFITPPLGYLDNLALMSNCKVVLTDSGGIQEETTALGVPCLTMRENTERWITVNEGTNTIVATDPEKIAVEFEKIMAGQGKEGRLPELWDGHAAKRIAKETLQWLNGDKNTRL